MDLANEWKSSTIHLRLMMIMMFNRCLLRTKKHFLKIIQKNPHRKTPMCTNWCCCNTHVQLCENLGMLRMRLLIFYVEEHAANLQDGLWEEFTWWDSLGDKRIHSWLMIALLTTMLWLKWCPTLKLAFHVNVLRKIKFCFKLGSSKTIVGWSRI